MSLLPKQRRKIVHVLEEDSEEEEIKMNLIPTTEFIKNIEVVYDEIAIEEISEDDFVITNVTSAKDSSEDLETEVVEETQEDISGDLMFDLPLNSYEEVKPETKTLFELTEDILNMEVNDPVEVVAEKEDTSTGSATEVVEKRFVLEDFDVEPTIK